MVEEIKAKISKTLTKNFKKRAMEIYGPKKGAIKAALEDAMKRFTASAKVDWKSLKGCIKSESTPVELQHETLGKVD
jgi:hypothetical protein